MKEPLLYRLFVAAHYAVFSTKKTKLFCENGVSKIGIAPQWAFTAKSIPLQDILRNLLDHGAKKSGMRKVLVRMEAEMVRN